MRHIPQDRSGWDRPDPANPLPPALDCETLALMRGFLTPILETAESWDSLTCQLRHKGFGVAFRAGHLVILKLDSGEALCTGRALGVPLRDISARIGKPCIRAHCGGASGELVD